MRLVEEDLHSTTPLLLLGAKLRLFVIFYVVNTDIPLHLFTYYFQIISYSQSTTALILKQKGRSSL